MRVSGAEYLPHTTVYDARRDHRLHVLREGVAEEISYAKLILATGARELFLPFPGWTLPHVLGAGGLQALVKSGLPIRGKRVVVAGSGPLLLAVASYLQKKGAIIPLIAEQTTALELLLFTTGIEANKINEAGRLLWQLKGSRYRPGTWVTSTQPGEVTLNNGRTVPCDYLACGFGLFPNLELPRALGCELRKGVVVVDELCRTTVPDVHAAGELNGIGGEELALVEGRLAGYAATAQTVKIARLLPQRLKLLEFRRLLARTFAPRYELRHLAQPDTIVCRCEDVRFAQLQASQECRDAKLQTRCGMGPCQGRVCSPACEFLFGWQPGTQRPPLSPVPLSAYLNRP